VEAMALRDCLAAGTEALAQRYFQQVNKVVNIPWSITVGNDLNLTEKGTVRPAMTRFINWYMSKVLIAARHDPVVTLAFMKVANLLAAPPSLLQPRFALRVLWGNFHLPRVENDRGKGLRRLTWAAKRK
jgi:hypothetical protein